MGDQGVAAYVFLINNKCDHTYENQPVSKKIKNETGDRHDPPSPHPHKNIFFPVTPHAQRERGKVIDRGVHIYIYIFMSVVKKKNLNRTLEIDSPFQTLTVGLLVEFID